MGHGGGENLEAGAPSPASGRGKGVGWARGTCRTTLTFPPSSAGGSACIPGFSGTPCPVNTALSNTQQIQVTHQDAGPAGLGLWGPQPLSVPPPGDPGLCSQRTRSSESQYVSQACCWGHGPWGPLAESERPLQLQHVLGWVWVCHQHKGAPACHLWGRF